MTKFLLIRHGESTHNNAKIFTGQIDAALSPRGEREAHTVCRYVLEHYPVDAVYASDLQRAMNTVRGIAEEKNLPLQTNCNLRELNVGEWGGKGYTEISAKYTENYRLFHENSWENAPAGGENYSQLYVRVSNALFRIAAAHPDQTVVIGTHGGVIRTLLAHWKFGRALVGQVPILPNCSVTELIYENGNVQFGQIGIADHLTKVDETANLI